jgi:hypothetical protein
MRAESRRAVHHAFVGPASTPSRTAPQARRLRRQSQKEAAAKLRPISAPTLVIWGERDSYLGSKLAEPDRDDVPNLDRVERLAERVNQLLGSHNLDEGQPPRSIGYSLNDSPADVAAWMLDHDTDDGRARGGAERPPADRRPPPPAL